MNNIYSILGLGLLGAAALSSCQQEEILKGGNGNLPEGTLSTVAVISGFNSENPNSRANVKDDGKTFYWNTDDKITIWDGEKSIEFSAKDYDENKPSNNVEFTGTGELADGATVWGIYPAKEGATADNVLSFTLADGVTQNADGKPHLNETMFMIAEGKVNGQTVTNLNFKHLTSVFHFNIQNITDVNYTVEAIEVQSFSEDGTTPLDVFPYQLTINEGEKNFSQEKNKVSLKFDNAQLDKGDKLVGYLSFLPSKGLTANSIIKIILKVTNPEIKELVLKEGRLGDLYKGTDLSSEDNFNYVAGKRYGVSHLIFNESDIRIDENGTYNILTVDGLNGLAAGGLFGVSGKTFKLNNNIEIVNSKAANNFNSINELKGIFDGNNKVISGINKPLFLMNSGTIKNLTINSANITLTESSEQVGILVGKNNNDAIITNCTIEQSTIDAQVKTNVGALAGSNIGTIDNCKINDVDIKTNSDSNIGGLVGYNESVITYCMIDNNTNVQYTTDKGNGNVGGLIGWSKSGTIKGCGASAIITADNAKTFSAAGLIGSAWFGQTTPAFILESSYSCGKISSSKVNGGSIAGLIGNAEGGCPKTITACYTTTQLPEGANENINYGGFVKKHATTTSNACFYSNIEKASSSGNFNGTNPSYVLDIKAKLQDLNNALTSSDYQFAEGTGEIPLIIVKKKQ